jgi:hypothetical protein
MLILVDSKMPDAAKQKLAAYGEVVEFATEGITYEAISGHPDIYFCPTPGGLIVAPNLPEKYLTILHQNHIAFTSGQKPVGKLYPESARYNTLVTQRFSIRNPGISEASIQKLNPGLQEITVRQGYIRCNLVALPNETFIASDRRIEKSLRQHNFEVLFVDPSPVKLTGFDHGFFGGACGLLGNTLFICGSLNHFKEKDLIEAFAARAGVQIIELFEGQPIDVGTILFLFTKYLQVPPE